MSDPLTPDEMVALAYRLYPRINVAEYRSHNEFLRDYHASSEVRALSIVQSQAWDRIEEFRELVRAVREALPPDYYAVDHTVPGHNAAYEAVFAPPHPSDSHASNLVLQVSYIVPSYVLYESHRRYTSQRGRNDRRVKEQRTSFDISDPTLVPIKEVVERELAKRYGYRPFDPELAKIPVPGIDIMGYYEDAPTLGIAMFAPLRW